MATKCHKTGHYLLENFGGVLTYRIEGLRKVYRGECAKCGRQHDLSAREVARAVKENRQWSP